MGGVQLSYMQMIIIATTVLLMIGFTLIITRTSLGRAQRACEQDQKMAALLGVNVDRTISLPSSGRRARFGGRADVPAPLRVIDFYIGFLAGVKAFTAAVLGGIGSLPGAMLGGLLIGLIEVFWWLLHRRISRTSLRSRSSPSCSSSCRRACSANRSGEGLMATARPAAMPASVTTAAGSPAP